MIKEVITAVTNSTKQDFICTPEFPFKNFYFHMRQHI